MKIVGLTGGIATGKSTVAKLIAARGVPVVDADRVAREVVEPGEPALDAVIAHFGREILQDDGRLDRAALRARIATDDAARTALNRIMHPAIGTAIAARVEELAREGHPVAVVEAALMIETGSYRLYDLLVVVTCSPRTQLARLLARDGGELETARGLLAAQLPLEDKEAVADVVIRNDGSLEDLAEAVDAAWPRITE